MTELEEVTIEYEKLNPKKALRAQAELADLKNRVAELEVALKAIVENQNSAIAESESFTRSQRQINFIAKYALNMQNEPTAADLIRESEVDAGEPDDTEEEEDD